MAKKHNWQKRGKTATLHVCIGTDLYGKPKRYTKSVPYTTENKVDKEWEKFYQECAAGLHEKTERMTVLELTEMVLSESVKQSAKKNTIRGYEICQKRLGDLGRIMAADCKPVHVQKWINNLSEKYAPKTVINSYSFLRMCFETAVGWELVTTSPCHHIKLPRHQKQEVEILNADELPLFLTALDTIPKEKQDYKVAIMLALFGGMRRGEICGLEEDAVDLESGKVDIVKTLNIENGGTYEDDPKSKTSIRTIYLPKEVIAEIRKMLLYHKEKQLQLGTKWGGSTKLLKGAFGADMFPGNLWEFLDQFQKENGLRHVSFHALRHTYTSILVEMDKPIAQISKQLGHSQLTTTLNIYAHMFQDPDKAKKESADDISKAFLQQNYNNRA